MAETGGFFPAPGKDDSIKQGKGKSKEISKKPITKADQKLLKDFFHLVTGADHQDPKFQRLMADPEAAIKFVKEHLSTLTEGNVSEKTLSLRHQGDQFGIQ